MWRFFTDINSLSASPTKWSNTHKQFVGKGRQIVWVCLTILWSWHLKGSKHYFYLRVGVMHLVRTQNFLERLIFLIHISCSYQEVRKISFSENFTYVLNRSSLTTFPKKTDSSNVSYQKIWLQASHVNGKKSRNEHENV